MRTPHLIYLSPVSINSFAQRPHHFVEWFHRNYNANVTWIEPGPSRYPQWKDRRRLLNRQLTSIGPNWSSESWLTVEKFPTLPVEPSGLGRLVNKLLRYFAFKKLLESLPQNSLLVIGKPCDLALQLLAARNYDLTVFDVMDNMSAFGAGAARRWMQVAEKCIAIQSDVLMTSSMSLESLMSSRYPQAKIFCVPNGLTPPPKTPQSLKQTSSEVPLVLGYIGVIASWFDWDSLARLARTAPSAKVRLYGPVECQIPNDLPKNIKFFPAIPHSDVYNIMKDFTFGLIPFIRNELTDYVDPIKYYEYRAAGIPILSTQFGDMNIRSSEDHVYFLEEIISEEINLNNLAQDTLIENNDIYCMENSWDARFDLISFFSYSRKMKIIKTTNE